MRKDNKKRKVGAANYIILAVIFIAAFLVLYLGRKVYLNYQSYNLKTVVLSGLVAEINSFEADNYISDSADALLYLGVSDDENSRDLEKEIAKLIKKGRLSENLVYINLSDTEDRPAFIKEFNEKYANTSEVKIVNYPALVLMTDREILASVSRENGSLDYQDVKQFLDQYELTQ